MTVASSSGRSCIRRISSAVVLSLFTVCRVARETHSFTQPSCRAQNLFKPIIRGQQRRNGSPLHLSSFTEDPTTSTPDVVDQPLVEESTTTISAVAPQNETLQNNKLLKSLASAVSDKIGKVDEERLVFPELSTGQVPRMFSLLKYKKTEEEGKVLVSASHAAGSTVGAAALIAGTTVGAGALALPTAAAPAGFLASTAAMAVAWWYMAMSGLLIAELCINRMGETGRPSVGLLELFDTYLAKPWGAVGSAAYFFLHYAILVACIAQGGSNLLGIVDSLGFETFTNIPGTGQIVFAAICGLAVIAAKPNVLDNASKALMAGVASIFVGTIAVGAGSADFGSLADPVNQHPEQVVNAFPILFLSMMYQSVVPTVVTQLEGDRSKITNAIVAGTTIPFLLLTAWNAIVLGNTVGVADVASMENLNPVALVQSGAEGPLFGTLVGGFSQLALITSTIGFGNGLRNAFTDVAGIPQEGPKYEKWKPALFAGILLPPLAMSLFSNPDIFYRALDFGGAFGVSTLFLVLPPLMVWNERYSEEQKMITTKPMVPFGKIPLASMWKAAATLIVEQGAEKLGIVDFLHEQLQNLNF